MALRNLYRVKEKYRCHDNIIINNIEKEKEILYYIYYVNQSYYKT